jgi:hypothetical protein
MTEPTAASAVATSGLFNEPSEFMKDLVETARHARLHPHKGPLTEVYIPRRRWYFAFNVDAKLMLPSLDKDKLDAFCARRKTYIAYMNGVSSDLLVQRCHDNKYMTA